MPFTKDPASTLDYTVDWGSGGWMPAGDSIASASWDVPETFLAPPTALIADPQSTGGEFAAGTYYWEATAVNSLGETTPSAVVSQTLTGTTSSVALGWGNVPGATGYKLYRGASGNGVPVTVDPSGSGTVGSGQGPALTVDASTNYTVGATANYLVAVVSYIALTPPSPISVTVGSGSSQDTMTPLGTVQSGFGGLAFFGLINPPSGSQPIATSVEALGTVIGVAVAAQSFVGWGATVFASGGGAENASPAQTVAAGFGDLVMWAASNVAGSGVPTALSGFTQTTLVNSGEISLPEDDSLDLLLGYAPGAASVAFAADVAQANIDQWWSAGALTLMPAQPPINELVVSIDNPSDTTYTDTGASQSQASPPGQNTAATSIELVTTPAPSTTDTTATAWIAGGVAGSAYTATCTIHTTEGRIDARTLTFNVVDL